ncbi:ubiquitin-2 like Rad60 SUMO-like-domain-containing protein [Trichophaea hybrida]|nr:ubiquitin-2 like Rad60 SUMO-like-domain-containing protein [Trichophaea hybrida]
MSSPFPESPPPIKKPRGKPKFNKLQLKKKTPATAAATTSQDAPRNRVPVLPAQDDLLDFFNRSKESYVPRIRSPIPKKRRSDDESYESPPNKSRRRGGGGGDSEEESERESQSRKRERAANMRQRYQARQKEKDTDSDSNGDPSSRNFGRSNARKTIRDNSLTPPPQISSPPSRRSPSPQSRRSAVMTGSSNRPPTTNLDKNPDHTPRHITSSSPPDPDVVITNPSAQPDSGGTVPNFEARMRSRMRTITSTAPIVNILVNSPIDNTKPLIIKRRLDQTLREVRQHWCKVQGFSPAQTADIFLVWKGSIRVSDFVSCKGIGVKVNSSGNLDASAEGVMKGNIHFEAMTEDILQRVLSGEGADGDEEEDKENGIDEGALTLMLKTKGKEGCEIKVRPNTTIANIIASYKKAQKLGEDKQIMLNFEGDMLSPEDTVVDADLEDMCMVDVHIH